MSTKNTQIKGYKVADKDGKCKGFLFEVGKEYKHEGHFEIYNSGFHFCTKAAHCFSYYSFDSNNKVFEVEAIGNVQTNDEDSKCATDHIRIVRQLDWIEVLQVANSGSNNTGYSNTGDRNTGYRNTGDRNTGYSNTGDWNTGDSNTGYSNTGDRNTGDWNTGYRNTGNSNTGDRNTGDRNTGDSNTGYRNTGDWNTGDRNTGYSNTGNRNTGAFCTKDAPFPMFNKKSNWTEQDFLNSRAYRLMRNYVNTKIFIPTHSMTDEEKTANPSHKTSGGYVKDIPFKEAFQNAWHNFDSSSRQAFYDLPNFDAEIFEEITGVKTK